MNNPCLGCWLFIVLRPNLRHNGISDVKTGSQTWKRDLRRENGISDVKNRISDMQRGISDMPPCVTQVLRNFAIRKWPSTERQHYICTWHAQPRKTCGGTNTQRAFTLMCMRPAMCNIQYGQGYISDGLGWWLRLSTSTKHSHRLLLINHEVKRAAHWQGT